MWPLLKKDGLGVQYIAMLLLWCRLIGYNPFRVQFNSFVHLLSTVRDSSDHHVSLSELIDEALLQAVNIAMTLLHLLEVVMTPPARYPDLFPVLNVLVSTPVFGLIWLWSIKRGIQVSWAIAGLPGSGANSNSNSDNKTKFAKESAQDGEDERVRVRGARDGRRWPGEGGVRRYTGMRAVSLGYASGQQRSPGVVGGRYKDHEDPRRRALQRLAKRAGSVEVEVEVEVER